MVEAGIDVLGLGETDVAVERLPERPPVPGRSAVVHEQHGVALVGERLTSRLERIGVVVVRPSVHRHDGRERRLAVGLQEPALDPLTGRVVEPDRLPRSSRRRVVADADDLLARSPRRARQEGVSPSSWGTTRRRRGGPRLHRSCRRARPRRRRFRRRGRGAASRGWRRGRDAAAARLPPGTSPPASSSQDDPRRRSSSPPVARPPHPWPDEPAHLAQHDESIVARRRRPPRGHHGHAVVGDLADRDAGSSVEHAHGGVLDARRLRVPDRDQRAIGRSARPLPAASPGRRRRGGHVR